jgi:hypothetical protein
MFADVALLAVYGFIVGLFLVRFVQARRLAALFVAALSLGWVLLAVLDLWGRLPAPGLLRWGGVLAGAALLFLLLRASARGELEV